MIKYEGPITKENFEQAWEFSNSKVAELKKKRIIRKVITPVGNVIFLFYIFVIIYGVAKVYLSEIFGAILNQIPVLPDVWDVLEPMLIHPEEHWIAQVLFFLIPAYVITVLVCIIIAVLIWFIYKPGVEKTLTEDDVENARLLRRNAKEIALNATEQPVATSFACNVLFVLGIMSFITVYIFYGLQFGDPGALQLIYFLISMGQMVFIVGALLLIGSYSALNLLLGYMLKLLYVTKVPEEFVRDAENYHYESIPEEKARIEEEERILALAQEITKRRREEKERERLELHIATRAKNNPIYKRIKIGIVVALVLAFVGVVIWFVTTTDMEELLEKIESMTTEEEVEEEGYYYATEVIEEYTFVESYTALVDEHNGYQLQCSDPAAGLMGKVLFKTIDGGETYEEYLDISSLPNYPCGMYFFSNDLGYIITTYHGENGFFYMTEDAGESWKEYELEIPVEEYSYVNGVSLEGGLLTIEVYVGEEVQTYYYISEDFGHSWNRLTEVTESEMMSEE